MKTILLLLMFTSLAPQSTFLSNQKKYERVQDAYKEKGDLIKEHLKKHNLNSDNLNIIFVAYKHEQELNIYAKGSSDSKYKKISTYKVCKKSGKLGPKRKQGDNQVPEGFYYIDRFNPVSSYHLSLGINYPNQSDIKKSTASNLGGDIFIHGKCVTIGCLPMTDDKMKEIYIYAIQAKHSGQQRIPVYIFPFKFTEDNMTLFKASYKKNSALLPFWENLKTGYNIFYKNYQEIKYSINKTGDYTFTE